MKNIKQLLASISAAAVFMSSMAAPYAERYVYITDTVAEYAETDQTEAEPAAEWESLSLGIYIKSKPDKTDYYIGEELDLTGGRYDCYLTDHYSDGSNIYFDGFNWDMTEGIKTITSSGGETGKAWIETSEFDSSKPGTYKIYVCCECGEVEKEESFEVRVIESALTTTTTSDYLGTGPASFTTTAAVSDTYCDTRPATTTVLPITELPVNTTVSIPDDGGMPSTTLGHPLYSAKLRINTLPTRTVYRLGEYCDTTGGSIAYDLTETDIYGVNHEYPCIFYFSQQDKELMPVGDCTLKSLSFTIDTSEYDKDNTGVYPIKVIMTANTGYSTFTDEVTFGFEVSDSVSTDVTTASYIPETDLPEFTTTTTAVISNQNTATTTTLGHPLYSLDMTVNSIPNKVKYGIGESLDTSGSSVGIEITEVDIYGQPHKYPMLVSIKDADNELMPVGDCTLRSLKISADTSAYDPMTIGSYPIKISATADTGYSTFTDEVEFYVEVTENISTNITTTHDDYGSTVTTTYYQLAKKDIIISMTLTEPVKKEYLPGQPLNFEGASANIIATEIDADDTRSVYEFNMPLAEGNQSVMLGSGYDLDFTVDISSYDISTPGRYNIIATASCFGKTVTDSFEVKVLDRSETEVNMVKKLVSDTADFIDGGFIYSDRADYSAEIKAGANGDENYLIVFRIGSIADIELNEAEYEYAYDADTYSGMCISAKKTAEADSDNYKILVFFKDTLPGWDKQLDLLDAGKNYGFDVAPYIYDEYVPADTDHDGVIDAGDASMILRGYARSSVGEDLHMNSTIFDCDLNGRVDAADASLALAFYAAQSTGTDKTWEEFISIE